MERAQKKGARQRVLIIGGGIAGAASAWALQQTGDYDCTVLERESQLGAHSTSKNASILRTLTGSWATTQLALDTAAFLAAPPAGFASHALVNAVGLILLTEHSKGELFERWLAQKPAGSVSPISPAQLHELLPPWTGHDRDALFIRDEGHLDVAALFDGLVRAAKLAGARFLLQAEVRELIADDGRVSGVLLAGGASMQAELVVLAAGGWAGKLGAEAGSELLLETRRRHLLVTATDARIDRHWPILWSEPDAYYMRPESGGWMLCACDQDVVHPDHCGELPRVREEIASRTADCLRDYADARVARFWSGIRTFTSDDNFAIGFDPKLRGLFWAAGLGGHGISTSIGVGRLAARLIAGEDVDPELARAMDPGRFVPSALRTS